MIGIDRNVQNLSIYNHFHIHFSIHLDPLQSLYFKGISLDPEIFTKRIQKQSVSDFIIKFTKLTFLTLFDLLNLMDFEINL